jgi:hypothetical protein
MTVRELSTLFEVTLSLLTVCGLIRFLLKPFLKAICVFRFEQILKELDQVCEKEGIPRNHFAAIFVRESTRSLIRNSSKAGLSGFIHYLVARQGQPSKPNLELQRFLQTAPPSIHRVWLWEFKVTLALMAANSLGWFVPGIFVFYGFKLLGLQEVAKERTESFVEERVMQQQEFEPCTVG